MNNALPFPMPNATWLADLPKTSNPKAWRWASFANDHASFILTHPEHEPLILTKDGLKQLANTGIVGAGN